MPILSATKLVSDVANVVKRQFGDESGTQITDVDIVRWTNLAQMDIIRKNKLNQAVATVATVVGQDAYSFPSDNILSIEAATYNNLPIDKTTLAETQKQADFISTTGTPLFWYEYGTSLYLVPTPVATDTLKIWYKMAPVELTTTSGALVVPDTYFETVVNYVLKLAYELDDDLQSAGVKESQVTESLAKLDSTDYATYPTITVLEDDL